MKNRGRGEGVRISFASPLHAPRGASNPQCAQSICAYFSSPRGCTYSTGILIQDFAVSVSQSLCGKSRVLINLQPLCLLFALFSALPSFVFKSLQPLFAKHPGWGVAATFLGRPSLRDSPLSGRLQRLFGLQYTLRPGSWQHRRIYTPPWINA